MLTQGECRASGIDQSLVAFNELLRGAVGCGLSMQER